MNNSSTNIEPERGQPCPRESQNAAAHRQSRPRSWPALALGLLLAANAFAATPQAGDAFPDLAQFGLEGALPDLRGKIVLVDFFASWCGPCQQSFPVLQELNETYRERGLVIIAVSVDQKKDALERFLKKHPAGFTVVRDAGGKLAGNVDLPAMPSSFVLDRDGVVRAVHRGFNGSETKKQYVAEIESLLK